MGFWLLSRGVVTVVEGVCDFNIAGGHRCARVFKLLLHLGAGAHIAILLEHLYGHNFLLSKRPSCLGATAVHGVSIEFLFRSSQDFEGGMVNVNKLVNKQSGLYS